MATKILKRVFCGGCFSNRTFKVLDAASGHGKCPKCGFTRFLPMGHVAEMVEADRAEDSQTNEQDE